MKTAPEWVLCLKSPFTFYVFLFLSSLLLKLPWGTLQLLILITTGLII